MNSPRASCVPMFRALLAPPLMVFSRRTQPNSFCMIAEVSSVDPSFITMISQLGQSCSNTLRRVSRIHRDALKHGTTTDTLTAIASLSALIYKGSADSQQVPYYNP